MDLIKLAHSSITLTKGREYAPDVHELQAWIDNYLKTSRKGRIDAFLYELERDYTEFSVMKDIDKSNPDYVKALIWNMLTSSKWRNKISYKDYSAICDKLLNRLK